MDEGKDFAPGQLQRHKSLGRLVPVDGMVDMKRMQGPNENAGGEYRESRPPLRDRLSGKGEGCQIRRRSLSATSPMSAERSTGQSANDWPLSRPRKLNPAPEAAS